MFLFDLEFDFLGQTPGLFLSGDECCFEKFMILINP